LRLPKNSFIGILAKFQTMDLVKFAEKRALEERLRKQAMREARAKKECAQVWGILQNGPASSREIATRLKIDLEHVRIRLHQLGAVRDERGR